MQYKKNSNEVFSRLTDLYSGNGMDRIYAKMNIPNRFLNVYRKSNPDSTVEYPDPEERILFWDKFLSEYADLEDDSIPCCYLSEFDEGLYGGILGAEIRLIHSNINGWISSMAVPFVNDLDETRDFILNETNIWFKRYLNQMKTYANKSRGKFGISHFVLINGLNLFFELRGATNTYYDILETPGKAKALIDFSIRLNIWIHETFFKTVGLYNGGTCSVCAQWIPGRILFESVDPFHLTSTDTFEEWGREPINKVFDNFDGGLVHLHGNGHQLLKNVVTLKGLKCVVFYDEDFNIPAYKKLDELTLKNKLIPMVVSIPFEVFTYKLSKKELPANILYDVQGVPDIRIANKLMVDVRKYKI